MFEQLAMKRFRERGELRKNGHLPEATFKKTVLQVARVLRRNGKT